MDGCKNLIDLRRRAFFARSAAAAAGAVATATLPASPARAEAPLAWTEYPATRLANLRDLRTNEPFPIAYPDSDSPGVLLKLGARVDDGAGPDGDVVAFSALCPHQGFRLAYRAEDRTLNCPGHYSRFDCERDGMQIIGQATQNLPRFRLSVAENDDIHAVSVDALIYGRISNVRQA